jgi:AcrR family transcriptional regulator
MPTPARTSLDEIIAAGRTIVEREGLDALTMQRVANVVGVRAPSLYKRVKSRDELLRLIVENLANDLAASLEHAVKGRSPKRDLRAIADSFRAFAHAHPRTYGLLFAPPSDPGAPDPAPFVRASGVLLTVTERLAGRDHALEAARTVVAWAHGFVAMELAGAFHLGGDVEEAYVYGIARLADALAGERT